MGNYKVETFLHNYCTNTGDFHSSSNGGRSATTRREASARGQRVCCLSDVDLRIERWWWCRASSKFVSMKTRRRETINRVALSERTRERYCGVVVACGVQIAEDAPHTTTTTHNHTQRQRWRRVRGRGSVVECSRKTRGFGGGPVSWVYVWVAVKSRQVARDIAW